MVRALVPVKGVQVVAIYGVMIREQLAERDFNDLFSPFFIFYAEVKNIDPKSSAPACLGFAHMHHLARAVCHCVFYDNVLSYKINPYGRV